MSTGTKRLQSLDALRGFDMFFIIGWGEIWFGLASLTGLPIFEWWAKQMQHAEWHGFTFYDMIFPLFLFIAGISFPFSMEKSYQNGITKKNLHFRIIKRGIILILLGMVYNGFLKFDFETARYSSVLGRIGMAWMFAAVIFINTKRNARIIWCAGLLIFYWLLMAFIPVPGYSGTDPFSVEGNLASYVDKMFLPGKMYNESYDPCGLLGIIPAVSTALLGMLTGNFVKTQKENLTGMKKTGCMVIAGGALIVTGLIWNTFFPINKILWTSSYVCFVGGISLLLFSLFYLLIDVLEFRKWPFFFTVIGLNSIAVYMAQAMINFRFTSRFIFGGFVGLFPESWAGFLNGAAYITVCWLFLYFLYRQKVFLKV